jgi:Protein of unknown function (DUF1638)
MADGPRTLFIACGALAREFLAVSKASGWDERMEVTCLPAIWHNTPNKIAEGVQRKIKAGKKKFDRIYVLYGDCGTGGELDRVLAEEGVERIEGPHCYQWFAGQVDFEKLMDEEPGTFFLTDYLARHFDRLIWQGFGIEKHPELRDMMFGNYRKLVFLAQTDDAKLLEKAKDAAARLGLEFIHRRTGYGEFADFIAKQMA